MPSAPWHILHGIHACSESDLMPCCCMNGRRADEMASCTHALHTSHRMCAPPSSRSVTLLAAAGVLCGAAASGQFTWTPDNVAKSIVCMIMSGPLLTGYTQTINDYYDRELDAINEPYRPIPSGAWHFDRRVDGSMSESERLIKSSRPGQHINLLTSRAS